MQISPALTAITRQGSVEEAAASRENEKNISQRLAVEAADIKKGLGDGNKQRDVRHAHARDDSPSDDSLRYPMRLSSVQYP